MVADPNAVIDLQTYTPSHIQESAQAKSQAEGLYIDGFFACDRKEAEHTQGQWWSILTIQRPQTLQWWARGGLKASHLQAFMGNTQH